MKHAHRWIIDHAGNGICLECGATKKHYTTLEDMQDAKLATFNSQSYPTATERIEAGDIIIWKVIKGE